MPEADSYKRIVRAVAVYDLVSTVGMAIPGVSTVTLGVYLWLHQHLGLAGDFPSFAPMHMAFVNITGLLAMFWSAARFRRPERWFTRYDIVLRLCAGPLLAYYIFARGMSQVFLVFVITELLGAATEYWALKLPAPAASGAHS